VPPAPTNPAFRVQRLAPGESAPAWSAALAAFDPSQAQVLKQDSAAAVYRATLLGRDVILKSWDLVTPGDRLKAAIRAGRADRHWRGAAWLLAHGLDTARPYAILADRRPGARRRWLIMEALPGKTVLQHLADRDLTVKQEHALTRKVGELISRTYSAGRFNRDCKPSNLIATSVDPSNPRIAVIDCVAIRRIILDDDSKLERMLASLYIEPLGCGCPPRKSLIYAALRSRWPADYADRPAMKIGLRDIWDTAADHTNDHGDPRPRINPLS